jgi:thioredoxin reductase (NADPH)
LAATELEKYVASMHRKTGLRPEISAKKQREAASEIAAAEDSSDDGDLFTAEMRQQLDSVFSRMEKPLLLRLHLHSRPISDELENFMTALTALSDKLKLEVAGRQTEETFAPCVEVCFADGTPSGLAFHGVPSGHEFTSFVLGLYNAAGPGQPIDEGIRQEIAAITTPTELKILVTLSCTMCPDLVVAAQRLAAENPNVTAHVYDIRHFEEIKKQYNVMSVPCLVINGKTVSFGKKNIRQILELLA